MPDKPPKLPPKLPRIGFAGFENSPAAGGGRRRKPRYELRPGDSTQSENEAVACRLVGAAELLKALGHKQVKE